MFLYIYLYRTVIYIAQILKRSFILNYFIWKCGNLIVSLLKESKNLITADSLLLNYSQRSYLSHIVWLVPSSKLIFVPPHRSQL